MIWQSIEEISLWELATLAILILIAISAFYISIRKNYKKPYYKKTVKDWSLKKPQMFNALEYSVFLLGDAGAISSIKKEPNLEILRTQLFNAGKDSAIFFLGDNIYPKGMPEKGHALFPLAEERILSQLNILDYYKGRAVFISGNHDWNKGRKGGLEAVLRQQDYVDDYMGREDVFLPRNGCPGPVELQLTDNLTCVVINTQWWVHSGRRPIGKDYGCDVENEEEFFTKLKAILDVNSHKNLLVVGHHPMYSKALHGGNFEIKQHLFPLTELHKKMYVPLPIAGSLYPMYRKYFGAVEDISHPRYRRMKKRLVEIFSQYDDLIYAAGHDHNLQYIKKDGQHYIVSGAGSKVSYVRKGKGASFTHAHKGFFRLNYYQKGDVWLEVWEPDIDGFSSRLAFRTHINHKFSGKEDS